jgi:hypothetical protein
MKLPHPQMQLLFFALSVGCFSAIRRIHRF